MLAQIKTLGCLSAHVINLMGQLSCWPCFELNYSAVGLNVISFLDGRVIMEVEFKVFIIQQIIVKSPLTGTNYCSKQFTFIFTKTFWGDRRVYQITILKYLLLVFSSRKRDVLIGKMRGPLNGKATDGFLYNSQQ